ncbi:serine/threonine-protein kinase [Actinoallomurus sp. NPDC052274]|uniref:serine/threonine-protein kinase n=1 Tax=Actinoallomurus sp. NPDC052274 TaxID=3155420 RepID=UPI0034459EBF
MSADDRIRPLRATDPAELGPYRVLGVVGRGGMGTVYLAESASGDRVAVKVINADFAQDTAFRDRFRREVAAARRVRRFCTAPVLDARVDEEPLYIVTEYVAGPDLKEFVRASGPMRGSSLDHLAVGVATALGAIHGAGIVHRDLKPANVLLSSTGPRVIDFGIARALDSVTEATRPGQIVGTPAYMAPEVLQGRRATTASDVFAWGAVVAFAGTGGTPFPGEGLPAVLYRIMHEAPVLDGLDESVRPLVERALDKDPARRPSAQELLAGLTGHARADTAASPGGQAGPPDDGARGDQAGPPGDVARGDQAGPPGGRRPAAGPGTEGRSAGSLPEPSSVVLVDGSAAVAARGWERDAEDASSSSASGSGATLVATTETGDADPAAGRAGARHRSRTRLIAWTAAAATAAVGGGIGAAVALMPHGGQTTRTVLIYSSGFSPDTPTWARDKYTSYVDGRYRMTAEGRAATANDSKRAPYFGRDLPAGMETSVNAAVVSGPRDGMTGLWCRGADDRILDGYVFLVRHDGQGAYIRKITAAGSRTLAQVPNAPGYEPTGAQGSGWNNFTIHCEPEGAKVRLRLWVNNRLTIDATDGDDTLADGQTGLVVMRGSGAHGGRTVVDFDDYSISRIKSGS